MGFQTADLKAEVERESTLTSFLTPEDENELIECNYAVLLAHFAKWLMYNSQRSDHSGKPGKQQEKLSIGICGRYTQRAHLHHHSPPATLAKLHPCNSIVYMN